MELVLRTVFDNKGYELAFNVCDDTIGFTVLGPEKEEQLDFSINYKEWESLKMFIDNEIKSLKNE